MFEGNSGKVKEMLEEIGNDHITNSAETPIRGNAFEMSDEEKIRSIQNDVSNILHTLGMDLKDDSLKGDSS